MATRRNTPPPPQAPQAPPTDRDRAIDSSWRWLKYQESTGEVKLDRDLVANLFDAAHDEGVMLWSGEIPAAADTSDLDPALIEAVRELQGLRENFRTKCYGVMNRIASLSGVQK